MKKIFIVGLLVLSIIINFSTTYAKTKTSSINEAKKKKANVESKLSSVKKKKEIVRQNLIDARSKRISVLSAKRKNELAKQQKIKELKALQKEISGLDSSINEAQKDYSNKKSLFEKRLNVMYQNSKKSIVEVLVESKNLTDFLGKIEVISLLAKRDKQLINEVDSSKRDLQYKKSLKITEKSAKSAQAEKIKQNILELSTKVSRAEDQISEYKDQLNELEKQEDMLIAESKKLASDIYKMQKQGTKYVNGKMKWPLNGYTDITSPFGNRYHPILHKRKMHTGIDIGAPRGVSIHAANKGTVIIAGWRTGYGNTVVIDHGGGIATLYGHASRILVSAGENVSAGQVIAKVGSTGYSTGPHLHFEVITNGKPTNPLSYFG